MSNFLITWKEGEEIKIGSCEPCDPAEVVELLNYFAPELEHEVVEDEHTRVDSVL